MMVADEVDPYWTKFLCGHTTGQKDTYVLRQASNKKVIAVCEAVEAYFFPK